MPIAEKQMLSARYFEDEIKKCRNDLHYFLREYIYTLDEHNLESPIGKLPIEKKPYILDMATLFLTEPLLLLEKSRQMLVTWTMISCHLWDVMFHRGRRIAIQSKKEIDANALIDRAKFAYNHLPIWMRERIKANPFSYLKLEFGKWHSILQGIPQGSDQLRQYTFSRIFCIDSATLILTIDLKWIKANSIKVGDQLVGFDEYAGVAGIKKNGERKARRWRKTIVKNVRRLTVPCYKLTFDDRTVIICSSKHRWLAGHGQRLKWLSTERLRARGKSNHRGKGWAGSKILKFVDIWEEDNDYEAGYLAGAFDGEGCLSQRPFNNKRGTGSHVAISVSQNENEMFRVIEKTLKKKKFENIRMKQVYKKYTSVHHTISIGNRSEVMRFLGQIRPKRLLEKLDISKWGSAKAYKGIELLEKEFIGDKEVIGITTTTGTFIAEGLASHNSDEMAFQEKSEEAFTAAKPTLTGGGSFIGVSSPNFKEFFFRSVRDVV